MNSFETPNMPVIVDSVAPAPPPAPIDLTTPSPESQESDSFGNLMEENTRKESYYFHQLSNLFREQLYSSLGSFVTTLCGKLQDNILTEVERTQTAMFCGDSAFHLQEYMLSETFYKSSIQMYNSFSKSSTHFKTQLNSDFHNDAKYKVSLCQMQCKKPTEALKTLQSIPAKMRSIKVNMALGRLYQQTGLERTAITSFKEVLKRCPMAMDVVESLMSLGLKESEIQSVIQPRNQEVVCIDWFNSWLKGSEAYHSGKYPEALNVYSDLQEKTALLNNHRLLVAIGKTNGMSGNYASAITPLLVAHANDCTNFEGMDFLAFLLWVENKTSELEKLALKLMEYNHTQSKSEPYLAMAYYCQLTARNTEALQFADKANNIQGAKNAEALICKGNIYMRMEPGESQDALPCYREASTLCPKRFEPQKGIFDCYMEMNRFRDAMTISTAFLKSEVSSRAYTMCAVPLTKKPTTMRKAKAYLDKALNLDNRFLPAVLLSVDIMEDEGQLEEAVNLLSKLVDRQPHPDVHNRLADLLIKLGKEDKAADHFNISLKLDPNNRKAKDGLYQLGQSYQPMDDTDVSVMDVENAISSDDDSDFPGVIHNVMGGVQLHS